MFKENMTLLEDAIKLGLFPQIETFECPYDTSKNDTGIIRIVFPEFTCVCPKTGYPDFATIALFYLPDKLCIELKSLKLYFNSFRMIGTFHETVASHIFTKINGLIKPRWAMLVGDFLPRGNVDTTVVFETGSQRPKGADVLLEPFFPHCSQTKEIENKGLAAP